MAKLGKYEISLDKIFDLTIRENFKNVITFLNEDPFMKGEFRFFQYKVTGSSGGTFTVPHALGFTPLDVILLSRRDKDTTTVTWQYDKFNDKSLSFMTNGPVTIRAFIGRYKD